MTPPKLSDSDKQEVARLYRLPEETTATIASRYEVSTTTVSRILRSYLPGDEYELLMQQKRQIRTHQVGGDELVLDGALSDDGEGDEETMLIAPEPKNFPDDELPFLNQPSSQHNVKSRSPSAPKLKTSNRVDRESRGTRSPADSVVHNPTRFSGSTDSESSLEVYEEEPSVMETMFDDEDFFSPRSSSKLLDLDEEDEDELDEGLEEDDLDSEDDLDNEDDLDLEDDLDDEGDDEEDGDDLASLPILQAMQILPLSEAILPKSFYLVVDRMSELITRPLKDFSDLGHIPENEIQSRTLPVFDNHRVARRFSRKNQKIIKVSDGNLLTKTSAQLYAKGINRLLINGRIYTIVD